MHGKGGSPAECAHYRPLFPGCRVVGLEYQASTPWEAREELPAALKALAQPNDRVTLIANSIGAFLSLCALLARRIEKAYFISPIVDMERLILDMMGWAGVTEEALQQAESIQTRFGETLSWTYLCDVRAHSIRWSVPTRILYGERDHLTAQETVSAFARAHGAELTVMPAGEHWFHTPEQMSFLDNWIRAGEEADACAAPHS